MLCKSFGCLKERMKVIVLQKLSFTILFYSWMHVSSAKFFLNRVLLLHCLIECLCSLAPVELFVITILQTRKGQDQIKGIAYLFKCRLIASEVDWIEDRFNDCKHMVCMATLVLSSYEYMIEAPPFC